MTNLTDGARRSPASISERAQGWIPWGRELNTETQHIHIDADLERRLPDRGAVDGTCICEAMRYGLYSDVQSTLVTFDTEPGAMLIHWHSPGCRFVVRTWTPATERLAGIRTVYCEELASWNYYPYTPAVVYEPVAAVQRYLRFDRGDAVCFGELPPIARDERLQIAFAAMLLLN